MKRAIEPLTSRLLGLGLLGQSLLLSSCEPPAAVIFELSFSPEVLASPLTPSELIVTFCPIATGCQRVIDYQKEIIPLGRKLDATETIAFAPGAALEPQSIFFEFVLVGRNGGTSEVIASAFTTKDIGPASYFRRQKISQGLVPGSSVQSIQDRTLAIGTRVQIPNLSVHGVGGANRNAFLAQVGVGPDLPAHPFFSGLTVRGSQADISPLQRGQCKSVIGTIRAGESGDVELNLEQITDGAGCTNSDPLPVAINDLQFNNDPQVLDGVLLQIDNAVVQPCSFNGAFFCALDEVDLVEVEISDFIFEGNNFDATMSNLAAQGNPVTFIGAGEMFLGNLFFLVPRNISDIQP